MVVFDRTVELAIPRTSRLRLRKGKEDAPAREHLAAVARNGFMAGETMRREERRKIGYLRTLFDEKIEVLREGKAEGRERERGDDGGMFREDRTLTRQYVSMRNAASHARAPSSPEL
jgi:hypothetical protein